jgi:hypothetical protein
MDCGPQEEDMIDICDAEEASFKNVVESGICFDTEMKN